MLAGMLAICMGIIATTRFTALPDAVVLVVAAPLLIPCLLCPYQWLRVAALAGIGVIWGSLQGLATTAAMLPPQLETQVVPIRACIEGLPARYVDGRGETWRFRARLMETPRGVGGAGPPWTGKNLMLSWYGSGHFAPGQGWKFDAHLRRPRGFANPGGMDYQVWLLSQGIDATGYVSRAEPIAGLCPRGVDNWRYALRERLVEILGEAPQLPNLLAISLGDQSLIDAPAWELYALTGTTHLIVVSGLQVSLTAMLLYYLGSLLARALRLPFGWPAAKSGALLAIPAAFAYAAMAGLSVPTQRALLMVTAMMAIRIIDRAQYPWLTFVMAMLAVLLLEPLAATQIGFWLSFLAVAALLFGMHGRVDPASRATLLWKPQLLVFGALFIPLVLAGQSVNLAAPLINAVALPLMNLLVTPCALLGCLLTGISTTLALPPLKLALIALGWFESFLNWAALVPSQQTLLPENLNAWTLPFALLATLLLLAPRGFPGRVLAIALLLPVFVVPGDKSNAPLLQVVVLDVGQGTALVLRTRTHALVYDTGPRFSDSFDAGRFAVLPALRFLHIAALDRMIISHGDNDHSGGAGSILAKLPVRDVLAGEPIPGWRRDTITPQPCQRGQHWHWDGVEFEMLYPLDGSVERGNNRSCVVRVRAGSTVLLLPGDLESEGERQLLGLQRRALRADVLLVPHHGSNTSSTPGFVAAVAPRYAVVSAGYRSRFGHPHPAVVARYRAANAHIINTAHVGAVLLRVNADGVLEEPVYWRSVARRWWFDAQVRQAASPEPEPR